MKKYPILYSRDSHGNIRTWQMVQSGDSYKTISGILNGSLVETEPTICLGKNIGRSNETTPKSQSEAEIEAKYRKQLAQGGYWEKMSDVDKTTFFSPQLAKSYEDYKDEIDWNKGVFVSGKLDGCVSGETLVLLEKSGFKTLKEIFDNKIIDRVLSYSLKKLKSEFQDIVGCFKNEQDVKIIDYQWFRIELENGQTINVTGNHLVYVKDLECWRRVDELIGSEIMMGV